MSKSPRVGGKYKCKFCGQNHPYPAAWKFCSSNPDAQKNREEVSAQARVDMSDKFILTLNYKSAEHKRKISERKKKAWAEGEYDGVDFNGRNTGKKHTEQFKRDNSIRKQAMDNARREERLRRAIEKAQIVVPLPEPKPIKNDGWEVVRTWGNDSEEW